MSTATQSGLVLSSSKDSRARLLQDKTADDAVTTFETSAFDKLYL